jgi:hypothetical protein
MAGTQSATVPDILYPGTEFADEHFAYLAPRSKHHQGARLAATFQLENG